MQFVATASVVVTVSAPHSAEGVDIACIQQSGLGLRHGAVRCFDQVLGVDGVGGEGGG